MNVVILGLTQVWFCVHFLGNFKLAVLLLLHGIIRKLSYMNGQLDDQVS